jgi:hypothetical protein
MHLARPFQGFDASPGRSQGGCPGLWLERAFGAGAGAVGRSQFRITTGLRRFDQRIAALSPRSRSGRTAATQSFAQKSNPHCVSRAGAREPSQRLTDRSSGKPGFDRGQRVLAISRAEAAASANFAAFEVFHALRVVLGAQTRDPSQQNR